MLGNLFSQRKDPVRNQQNQTVQSTTTTATVSGNVPVIPVVPVVPIGQTVVEKVEQNVVQSSMEPQRRQDFSALTHLDARASSVLSHAQGETSRIKQANISPDQLLFGLLCDEDIFKLLGKFSLDVAKITRELQSRENIGNFTGEPTLSEKTKQIFEKALVSAKGRNSEFITPQDLLLTVFSESLESANFLEEEGLKKEDLEEKLSKDEDFSYGKKSVLQKFGIDLTDEAKQGTLDPVAGREKEIERMVHIMLRRSKNNPIIIGEAGVGKTAVVEGLAQAIVKGTAPKDLLQKKIYQLDLTSLVAGASHRGEFEERLRSVIKEAQAATGQIILFIDEIHTLIGTGDTEGALDASNIIKPFLARGQLQIIGTTTTAEYRRYFEKDRAFERRFQPILVEEPSEEAAVEMLNILKPKYEAFHKVVLTDEAINSAVHLSKRYIGERYLPDKGVDLLDEAAAEVRLAQTAGLRADNQVKESDIEKIVSSWTGIPITQLTEKESEKLLHLEDLMHKRLINQEAAVKAVSEAVRRGRIGLSAVNRPIASFVFLGPTGVGKTELAKTLAEILFGREDLTIRLDMSEYMEKHEVAKLIGAPPGYVGYEEGGQLTEAVRRKPYSIVLLDEIEKAHPDVLNILLQLLEDGRLTDNKGNTISFKNTIIIATSNIGSALIQQQLTEAVGQTDDPQKKFAELSKLLMAELRKFFKPELLNRFDEVVIFESLSRENMLEVAKLGINSTKKLLKEQNVDLEATQVALARLAEEGYDPIYGARPLRRLIQSSIENPIAVMIIEKTFTSGDTILIDYDKTKESFVFTKAVVAPPNSQQQPLDQQPPVQNGVVSSLPNQPASTRGEPVVGADGTQMAPSGATS